MAKEYKAEQYIAISKRDFGRIIKRIYDEITENEELHLEIEKTIVEHKMGNIPYVTIIKEEKKKDPTKQKHKYGEYKNVLLTDQEYETLANMENGIRAIEYMSEYIAYKGYKAKSHYLAIRKWVFDALKEQDLKKSRFQVSDRSTGEQKLDASIPDEELGNVDM